MGAGATKEQIASGIRRNLEQFAKTIIAAGGTATSNQILAATLAGKQIKACYRIIRASNGEVAGILCLNVNGTASEAGVFESFEYTVQEIIDGKRG
jgi:predicted transcriptional regulator YheO